MFKPHARATVQVGYSITSVDGQTPQFNVLQPPGSLQYNYYQPLANHRNRHWTPPHRQGGMELLPVRGGILCGTYRSSLFPCQQCDIFSAVGFLTGPQRWHPCTLPSSERPSTVVLTDPTHR